MQYKAVKEATRLADRQLTLLKEVAKKKARAADLNRSGSRKSGHPNRWPRRHNASALYSEDSWVENVLKTLLNRGAARCAAITRVSSTAPRSTPARQDAVFPGHESDFFRNRLTHSLEVAQIAESIAYRLNYDEKLFRRFGAKPRKNFVDDQAASRVHGRRLAWRFGWQRSGDRSVLGCAVRASGGVAEPQRARV